MLGKQEEISKVSSKSNIVRATKVNAEDFRILGAGLGDSVSEDAQAEEATEEKSESEKISNQGNDAEGSQKPQDTLNVTEVNPKQPSTGKTPNAEQQELLNAQIEQTKEVAEEEKSEQEKSVNAQELLQEQNEPANAEVPAEQEQQQTLQEQENLVQGINIKAMINNLTDALGKFDVATEKMEALHSVRAIESNILVNKLGNAIKTINTLNNNLATLSNLMNTTTDVLVARTQTMDDFGKSVADDINDKQEITGIGVKIIEEESLQEIGEEAIKNIKKLSKGNGALTLATSLNEVKKDFDSINAMYGNKFSHLKALM